MFRPQSQQQEQHSSQQQQSSTTSMNDYYNRATTGVRHFVKNDIQLNRTQSDFFGAWLSHFLCLSFSHPIDTIRVRWQTLGRTPLTTLKQDSIRSLYAGVLTPIFAQGPMNAIVFTVNEGTRYWLLERLEGGSKGKTIEDLSLPEITFAGLVAGTCISLIQTPLAVIRVQQQNAAIRVNRTLSAPEVLSALYKREGFFRGVYRGWTLEATTNGAGRGAYFVAYEGNKRLIANMKGQETASNLSMHEKFVAGYGTSIMSWFLIFPFDVIKNKMQADFIPGLQIANKDGSLSSTKVLPEKHFKSMVQCARETYKENGLLKGFFRGYPITVFRSGILTGCSLPLYEYFRLALRGSDYE